MKSRNAGMAGPFPFLVLLACLLAVGGCGDDDATSPNGDGNFIVDITNTWSVEGESRSFSFDSFDGEAHASLFDGTENVNDRFNDLVGFHDGRNVTFAVSRDSSVEVYEGRFVTEDSMRIHSDGESLILTR